MVAIPTMEEEDAGRPSRERECLVNERSRITNRMKSALARLGVRGFKPHLRKAPERLADLRTAEGTAMPVNIIEELRREMARLALIREQINSIEKTRAERLERAPDTGPHAMVRCSPGSSLSASRQRICWCGRFCRGGFGIEERWRATPGSRDRPTRAV
jgi:transposase